MNIINSNLKFKNNRSYGNRPNTIVLHHADISHCTIQDIHSWHLQRGWSGCGYHYLVKKDGSIYKGRPDNMIGAHCLNHNTNTLGVCAEGNFMNETMEQVQSNVIIQLCKYLKGKYGISKIYGHRELNSTDCPGNNYPLNQIRNAVMNGKVVNTNVSHAAASTEYTIKSGDTLGAIAIKFHTTVGNLAAINKIANPNVIRAGQRIKVTGNAVSHKTSVSTPNSSLKQLQHEFNVQGFRDSKGNKLSEDGLYGWRTQTAANRCTVRQGARGNITKWIQQRLIAKGYGVGKYGADGVFGAGTLAAVAKFQKDHGLGVDGIVGRKSWRELMR